MKGKGGCKQISELEIYTVFLILRRVSVQFVLISERKSDCNALFQPYIPFDKADDVITL